MRGMAGVDNSVKDVRGERWPLDEDTIGRLRSSFRWTVGWTPRGEDRRRHQSSCETAVARAIHAGFQPFARGIRHARVWHSAEFPSSIVDRWIALRSIGADPSARRKEGKWVRVLICIWARFWAPGLYIYIGFGFVIICSWVK